MSNISDERWMRRCLELAVRARGKTSPNPMVGCVVVSRAGRVLAEGYHTKLGAPHAEAAALATLKPGAAKGATVYVNLEPCAHTRNRRTGPCAPLLADALIGRLVIGVGDPIRSHAGGARALEKLGVSVTRGVLADECRELNRAFFVSAKAKRPWFVVKAAITADGRTSTHRGEAKWITGKDARKDGRAWRGHLDAIIVGSQTVIDDDPRLTVRARGGRDPVRIVLDRRLRTPLKSALLPGVSGAGRAIIVTVKDASIGKQRQLEKLGAEIWHVPKNSGAGLRRLSQLMMQAEMCSALVEGGAEAHGAFFRANLVDDVLLYVSPRMVGGSNGWVGGKPFGTLATAPHFRFFGAPRQLGADVLLHLRP